MEGLGKIAILSTLLNVGSKAAGLFAKAGQGTVNAVKGSFKNNGLAKNFKNQALVGGGLTAAMGGNYTEFAAKGLKSLPKSAGMKGFKMPSMPSFKTPKLGAMKGLSNIKQKTTNNLTTKFSNTVKSALNSPKL